MDSRDILFRSRAVFVSFTPGLFHPVGGIGRREQELRSVTEERNEDKSACSISSYLSARFAHKMLSI